MVCCFKFGQTNPLYISCDSSYIKYCENNINKYLRVEAGKSEDCKKICSLKSTYIAKCDCSWFSNGICYNYMYCWKNEINGLCTSIYTKDAAGDTCLFPSFLPEYKKYEFKMSIGNSEYVTGRFNALKKKGQTKTCNC